jgi:UDP-glucose 4-epimerase
MSRNPATLARVRDRRVLVTGARGFIGSALCRRLRDLDAEVHAVSRAEVTDADGVRWWRADLGDPGATSDVVRSVQPELVMHLASRVSGDQRIELVLPTLRSNLLSTINVLTAANEVGCERFVATGTMVEPDQGDPETVADSPYAAAKWAASGYARMYQALYALPVVSLRLFMVYGPGQLNLQKLVPHVVVSLLRGEAPRLASGRWEVDWVYVEDVVDAYLGAATAPGLDGVTADVGSGELHSIRSVVERLVRITGNRAQPEFGVLEDRPLGGRRIANTALTRELIGWTPTVSLEEGLERTAAWYRERLEAGELG